MSNWKFKEGDLIAEMIDPSRKSKGRIISSGSLPEETYKIFWLDSTIPDKDQFKLFDKAIIEQFYEKASQ